MVQPHWYIQCSGKWNQFVSPWLRREISASSYFRLSVCFCLCLSLSMYVSVYVCVFVAKFVFKCFLFLWSTYHARLIIFQAAYIHSCSTSTSHRLLYGSNAFSYRCTFHIVQGVYQLCVCVCVCVCMWLCNYDSLMAQTTSKNIQCHFCNLNTRALLYTYTILLCCDIISLCWYVAVPCYNMMSLCCGTMPFLLCGCTALSSGVMCGCVVAPAMVSFAHITWLHDDVIGLYCVLMGWYHLFMVCSYVLILWASIS